ncbi:MAG: S16 family serine protease [Candidatus Aenigmatarchaeota archaeon]
MRKKFESNRKIIFLGLAIIIGIAFVGSRYIHTIEKKELKTFVFNLTNITQERFVKIYVPAVDNEGKGIASVLKVGIKPGSGKVLVDINQILFWLDTQQSIQTAKRVAQEITKVDLSKFDLIYSIEDINATVVEGPSAGAALTIATIAAIEGKELNNKISITGTINPDGSIGPVGGIIPKAEAIKEIGGETFLVPKGQGTQVNYIPEEKCEQIGYFTFCTTTYKKKIENVGKVVGINVVEVSNIKEAMSYFGL